MAILIVSNQTNLFFLFVTATQTLAYVDNVPNKSIGAFAMTVATKLALELHRRSKKTTPCNITAEGRERGQAIARANRIAQARAEYAHLEPMIKELREEGLALRAIASILSESGNLTRSGIPFSQVQVRRILLRMVA